MKQRISSFARAAILVFLFVPVVLVASGTFADEPQKGPVNPALQDWLSGKSAASGASHGYVPAPVDWSHLSPIKTKDTPPAAFDLRDTDGVTSVKNQYSCGACWAFAACAALESWLKIHNGETFDFSENHMKNTHGFVLGHCDGGNNQIAAAYLSRWDGPLLESEDPYDPYSSTSPSPAPPPQKLLTYAPVFTAAGGDRTEIQNALMDFGALSTMMYYDDSRYNSADATYYSTASPGSEDHMVTVVGWDDAKSVSGAPGPGAWICKNSWGDTWGEGGYFYISYYDTLAVKEAAGFFHLESPNAYGRLYEYDPLGMTGYAGYSGETAYGANVFTAVENEAVVAVGTYALTNNTAYEITVYDSGISGGNFYNPVTTVSGVFEHAGYHVVDLPVAVNVVQEQPFSVKVRYQTPGWGYPLPLEGVVSGYAQPTAATGQSYMSGTGSGFVDIHAQGGGWANTNMCIKAIAAAPGLTVRIVGTGWAEEGQEVVLRSVLPVLVGDVVFEWYKDEAIIIGAETDTFVISSATLSDAGLYRLVVTDESKALYESDPFELIVFSEGSLPVSGVAALAAAAALVAAIAIARMRRTTRSVL
ncbi:MAG TPA: surface layer protein B [Candidatus Hydrogenedentes bacterium]|nr:surface layer protein B [Candidatus Hydrogenedentota bacterium]